MIDVSEFSPNRRPFTKSEALDWFNRAKERGSYALLIIFEKYLPVHPEFPFCGFFIKDEAELKSKRKSFHPSTHQVLAILYCSKDFDRQLAKSPKLATRLVD